MGGLGSIHPCPIPFYSCSPGLVDLKTHINVSQQVKFSPAIFFCSCSYEAEQSFVTEYTTLCIVYVWNSQNMLEWEHKVLLKKHVKEKKLISIVNQFVNRRESRFWDFFILESCRSFMSRARWERAFTAEQVIRHPAYNNQPAFMRKNIMKKSSPVLNCPCGQTLHTAAGERLTVTRRSMEQFGEQPGALE